MEPADSSQEVSATETDEDVSETEETLETESANQDITEDEAEGEQSIGAIQEPEKTNSSSTKKNTNGSGSLSTDEIDKGDTITGYDPVLSNPTQ